MRLMPQPEMYRTVLAAYDDLGRAGDAVSMVVASGLLPGAMEIMDRLAIKAAEASVNAGYPDAEALLIVELEGETPQVNAEFERLQGIIDESGAFEARVAKDEEERARIWKGRKGAFSAVGRLSPDYIVQDGVVPRSRLGEALVEIGALKQKYGLDVANVFHAGDGNLHPLILYDGRETGALEKAEALAGEILGALHQSWRVDNWRAWHRHGKARIPAGDVQRRRNRYHGGAAAGDRPGGNRQSRQDVPGWRSARANAARHAPT